MSESTIKSISGSEDPKPLSVSDKEAEKKTKDPSVSLFKLFRFSTTRERFLMAIAALFSIGSGALQPASIIIFGSFISKLTSNLNDTSQLLTNTLPVIKIMAYFGTAVLVCSYVSNCLWIVTGGTQTRRIRTLFVHSVLRQDMSWFDKADEGSLNTRLANDTQMIQEGISEKFGLMIMLTSQFISGFVIAFVYGWKLALVMLASMPILIISGASMGYYMSKFSVEAQDAYAFAGSIAEQALNSIRTVYSFSLQKRFSKRYNDNLEDAYKLGIRRATAFSIGLAMFMFSLFGTYALALWYGATLVTKGQLDGSTVLIVFLAMMLGCMSFLQLPQNLASVASACGAAYKIFAIIDRIPEIDVDDKAGLSPKAIDGTIEFKNLMFKYPTRPDLTIIKNLSLKINPGMTVAFVGPSGCGKSTIIQLLQRFYNPCSGQITIDGQSIDSYNVKWLRQNIGTVGQEPVLFNMTIRQNLLMGSDTDVPEETLINACKEANCHNFISCLPKGYDTLVGEQGGMLSGGQKQRIAIARAILKNPTILLLDEATSALDTQSERLVQQALDKVAASRTTIVVAHRLSTIINADLIVVMENGNIIEQGNHTDLLALNGVYSGLVRKQRINTVGEENIISDNKTEEVITEVNTQLLLQQEEKDIQQKTSHLEEKEYNDSNLVQVVNHQNDLYQPKLDGSEVTLDAYNLKLKKQKEGKKNMKKLDAPVTEVLSQMKPEWNLIALGVLGAGGAGAVFPVYAFLFSKVISIITTVPKEDIAPGPVKGVNLYAFLNLILAICAFVGFGLQIMCFEVAGERYTRRLRGNIFAAYMRQEIGFFDKEENNVGALTTKMAVDASSVNEMVTKVWGDIAQLVVTTLVGLIIAFIHSWALTLIVLCMAPFIMAASAYESRVHRGFEDVTKKANAASGEVAGEAIREIRTVAALNKQDYFEHRYFQATEHPHKIAVRKAYMSSIAYALNCGISLYTNALAFYAGVRLIMIGNITFTQMFTTMTVIMIAAEGAGRTTVFVSTFAKAKYAAISSFEILFRQPEIDFDLEGLEPTSESVDGAIGFENIKFAYPARPDQSIFHGQFNLKGKPGQTIALVGSSGCGKSTTIGMLQRWYDPLGGTVSLDSTDVKNYSLGNLRSHMSLVGQEPVLFDMTIGENIMFGVDDNKVQISQHDVVAACKSANIHDFIVSLPQGYDTRVGDKGSQLSGGQKQRIAIARALIGKPKVLLLDEATSALDSESERLVQDALDNILEKDERTTITIAHRLSTIQKSDLICVVKDGRVSEQGTHQELLSLKGTYASLVQEQSLAVTN